MTICDHMTGVRHHIDAAIQHLRECDGEIPDLLDQCSRLEECADDVDALHKLPLGEMIDSAIRIADRIREQVESIKREMGQP